MTTSSRLLIVASLVILGIVGYVYTTDSSTEANALDTISFNRDIRPILNKNCTGCHGGVGKQANVSFIYRDEALGRGHSGRLTIVPGNPDASELIARIESNDVNVRMPYKAPALSEEEILLLRNWIKQGAKWEEHWAFVKPVQAKIPTIKHREQVQNEIDHFVQRTLEKQNLSLAPKADKTSLLRRVSFDLTGLPPSAEDIETFLRDSADNAFEKQVDRLLASPRYGERWAAMWMDLARYADSQGYTRDQYRETWPYKSWVIDAFNQNKSYKDFVIEQLAGDLLPNRNIDNLVATGFHRQTPINSEGGTDDEEFRMVAVMDRVATTWSVLNATTMNCVQCHAHPYDPIEHDEYYRSMAFLNTTQDADKRNDSPLLKYPLDGSLKSKTFDFYTSLESVRSQTLSRAVSLDSEEHQWKKLAIKSVLADEKSALESSKVNVQKKLTKQDLKPYQISNFNNQLSIIDEKIKQLEQANNAKRYYQVQDGELYETGTVSAQAYLHVKTEPVPTLTTFNALKLTALPLHPKQAQHTPEWAFSIDDIRLYVVAKNGDKRQIYFSSFMANSTEVIDEQLSKLSWIKPHKMGEASAFYSQRLFNPRWTVGVLSSPLTVLQGEYLLLELDQVQGRYLNEGMPSELHRLRLDASTSTKWLDYVGSDDRQELIAQYQRDKKALSAIEGVMTPVMLEQDAWDQRSTALFSRGNFLDKIGEPLTPNTPAIFPAFDLEKTRLGLAKWFFKDDQPLTARVAVNRFWQRLMGIGIVESLEDFGSAGTLPSHPELLDWLALKFQHDLQWDMKKLIKLIVMSGTYQQDAKVSAALFEQDPQNRLFARGPRQRLSSEMVRDQALAASGLLNLNTHGAPVMPPQPDGIWGRKGVTIKDWTNATDTNRYRRAIYTFMKRAYLYPSFLTFDMETREISHARRTATNTPLQALVTLNDPVYHEAAQALGKDMINYLGQHSLGETMSHGFSRVISRQPNEIERQHLMQAYEQLNTDSRQSIETWAAMASIILNLDSALTR